MVREWARRPGGKGKRRARKGRAHIRFLEFRDESAERLADRLARVYHLWGTGVSQYLRYTGRHMRLARSRQPRRLLLSCQLCGSPAQRWSAVACLAPRSQARPSALPERAYRPSKGRPVAHRPPLHRAASLWPQPWGRLAPLGPHRGSCNCCIKASLFSRSICRSLSEL